MEENERRRLRKAEECGLSLQSSLLRARRWLSPAVPGALAEDLYRAERSVDYSMLCLEEAAGIAPSPKECLRRAEEFLERLMSAAAADALEVRVRGELEDSAGAAAEALECIRELVCGYRSLLDDITEESL